LPCSETQSLVVAVHVANLPPGLEQFNPRPFSSSGKFARTRNATICGTDTLSSDFPRLRRSNTATDAWDVYWRGTREAAVPVDGGVRHPVVRSFWIERLSNVLRENPETTILDLASGDGAILDILASIEAGVVPRVTCIDSSPAAIAVAGSRFPGVKGVIADAADVPLDDRSFDLVTSQFGVEYAGPDAIGEAARLVAPGGRIILLMHMAGSLMHSESKEALEAIAATEESGFLPLALTMFERGFAAVRGADRRAYDEAATELNPAVRQVEKIIARHGEHVAGGTIAALYSGVAAIHAEIQHYEPGPVLDWLHVMQEELRSFAGRMLSMDRAALREPEYTEIRRRMTDYGYAVDKHRQLTDRDGTPLGWTIIATASR
jgi:ubiquinone/menaquinone biosynthesis C-methylase UbiE